MFGFGSKKTETKDVTLADPDAFWLFGLVPDFEVPKGAEAAFRCTSSRAAIRIISETLAVLPIHIFERGEGKERERAYDHPVEKVISGRASPWLSASQLRREMTVHALVHGRAFARVIRVGGEVRELQFVPCHAVTVNIDTLTGEPNYTVSFDNGGIENLDWSELIHLRPLADRSPVRDASKAIALSLSLEDHGERLFRNGARPSGVLKMAGTLTAPAAERIRESWQAAHGGQNGGRTAVLEEGTSFDPLGLTSTDAQYLENRAHQVEDIARAFAVPSVLIGDYGRATWSNSSEVGRLFVQYCILPWLQAWQDAYTTALLTADEQARYFIEGNADGLARGDLESRFNAYSKAGGGASWLTPDELRAMDNRPPAPGGDKLRQPLNTSTQPEQSKEVQANG